MKTGAQFYTIRDFCKDIQSFDTSCKKVAETGYTYVQLSAIGDFCAEDVKKITDKYGLKVVCTHRPPNGYLENIEGEIHYHKTLGCKICGIGCMPAFNASEETIEDFAKKFVPVAARLKEEGLIFGYHNHAFEFRKTNGRFGFDILTEKMSGTDFKYILDVYWLAVAGLDPAKFITTHADSIACVHLKDLTIKENAPMFCEVGKGNLNWREILEACEKAGVEYALVEQDICETDPFDCLATSRKYIEDNFPQYL